MKHVIARARRLLVGLSLLAAAPVFAQQGYLVTMGGNGIAGSSGDGGQALSASLTPADITFDASGNIFFLDGQSVRKVRPDGVITTVATLPATGTGLAVAKDGSLFVAMSSELRRIATNGAVTTYAETVTGMTLGPDGSLYMADPTHHRVRRMASSGVITTFAGNGTAGDCLQTEAGIAAVSPCLTTPRDIAVRADGTVFITDVGNVRTYLVSNGQMHLLAISASVPFAPARIALSPDGSTIYGLLANGNAIEAAQARQLWENYAGWVVGGTGGFNGDQLAVNTWINGAADFDIDAQGNLIIADTQNHRLRRMRLQSPAAEAAKYESDYLGDDLVWRNRKTGANVEWFAYLDYPKTLTAVTDLDWEIVASGDFDGDKISDLFWRNHRTGGNAIWRSAIAAQKLSVPSVTDLNWRVVGSGDFDGDGRKDVLWRNQATGKNVIWLRGQATTKRAVADAAPEWQVAGIGDFWADGKADILWRNSVTGANIIWRSGNAATPQAVAGSGLGWTIAGVGDFDGEGRSDILWRSNTGSNVIWLSANARTPRAIAPLSPAWTVGSIGDYDLDWASDLFWRNTVTGENVIWSAADSLKTSNRRTVSLDWVLSANPAR
jgi:hypothetical protein